MAKSLVPCHRANAFGDYVKANNLLQTLNGYAGDLKVDAAGGIGHVDRRLPSLLYLGMVRAIAVLRRNPVVVVLAKCLPHPKPVAPLTIRAEVDRKA